MFKNWSLNCTITVKFVSRSRNDTLFRINSWLVLKIAYTAIYVNRTRIQLLNFDIKYDLRNWDFSIIFQHTYIFILTRYPTTFLSLPAVCSESVNKPVSFYMGGELSQTFRYLNTYNFSNHTDEIGAMVFLNRNVQVKVANQRNIPRSNM